MANPSTFQQGANLGMWKAPEGVDPTTAFTLERLFPSLTPDQQFEQNKKMLDYMDELQTRQAEKRQKLGEESTKKSLLYSMLAKLPEQIANAASPYGGPAGAYMAYEGMSRIPAIFSDTLRSTPQMNINFPGASMAQFKYFS
jgi:hypothetical protein